MPPVILAKQKNVAARPGNYNEIVEFLRLLVALNRFYGYVCAYVGRLLLATLTLTYFAMQRGEVHFRLRDFAKRAQQSQ